MSQPTALLGAPTAQPWRYSRESCTASQGRSVTVMPAHKVNPMALKMLKQRLQAGRTSALKVLDTKAGATQRIRGRSWMSTRREVLIRDGYRCCDCGRVHASNEIDHEIPLEQGGSAMGQENLKVRCVDCHKAKSASETKARFGH